MYISFNLQDEIRFGVETQEQHDKRNQTYHHHSCHRCIQPQTFCKTKKYFSLIIVTLLWERMLLDILNFDLKNLYTRKLHITDTKSKLHMSEWVKTNKFTAIISSIY